MDNWKTIPNSGKAERKFSQNWHRDPEDAKLVKVFLYMKDIPAEAGPFEYILDTKNGNTYAHINPQDVPYGSYIDDAKLRKEIPAENFIAAAYPKYTLLFVDTTGIHRGGFAISDGRLLSHWTYVTMACPYVRFIIPEPDAKIQLNAAQKDLLFYK